MASKDKIFVVMELVTGGELFDQIVAEGPMKVGAAGWAVCKEWGEEVGCGCMSESVSTCVAEPAHRSEPSYRAVRPPPAAGARRAAVLPAAGGGAGGLPQGGGVPPRPQARWVGGWVGGRVGGRSWWT